MSLAPAELGSLEQGQVKRRVAQGENESLWRVLSSVTQMRLKNPQRDLGVEGC